MAYKTQDFLFKFTPLKALSIYSCQHQQHYDFLYSIELIIVHRVIKLLPSDENTFIISFSKDTGSHSISLDLKKSLAFTLLHFFFWKVSWFYYPCDKWYILN